MFSAAADPDKTCSKSNKTRRVIGLHPDEGIRNRPAGADCDNGSDGTQKRCHVKYSLKKFNKIMSKELQHWCSHLLHAKSRSLKVLKGHNIGANSLCLREGSFSGYKIKAWAGVDVGPRAEARVATLCIFNCCFQARTSWEGSVTDCCCHQSSPESNITCPRWQPETPLIWPPLHSVARFLGQPCCLCYPFEKELGFESQK